LARAQHGLITRRQLLALGYRSLGIEHRLRTGRLHRVHAGVYLVGRPGTNSKQRWMGAVLACGDGAVLSHRSAAALWGIGRDGALPEASAVREKRRPRVRTHTRPGLRTSAVTVEDGIPVTTPVQTLLDIALQCSEGELERAVNDADKRDLVDPETLRIALDDHPGDPGVVPLRDLLDRDTFRLSDDELERRFRPIAVAAGLPTPLTKQIVNEVEVDFWWPQLGLVVETDGLRYHRTPAQQARDARRDQAHTAAGLARLRFTHWQVRYRPTYVRDILIRTRAHLPVRGAWLAGPAATVREAA
jgi:hypothetical protein